MSNHEKASVIKKWIDPEERVTVQFDDERDISAEVTGCDDQLIFLSLDTQVPHIKQQLSIPLGRAEISEDHAHYTRDPDRPLKRKRLMLIIQGNRPAVVY